jgi:hypothetical protein
VVTNVDNIKGTVAWEGFLIIKPVIRQMPMLSNSTEAKDLQFTILLIIRLKGCRVITLTQKID